MMDHVKFISLGFAVMVAMVIIMMFDLMMYIMGGIVLVGIAWFIGYALLATNNKEENK